MRRTSESVRRTAAVAAVLADGGFVVICAVVSPFAEYRAKARCSYPGGFYEVWVAHARQAAEGRTAAYYMEYVEAMTRP
jgi:adenylylsulfate kinase